MADPNLKSEISKMTQHIPIIGANHPEKLAEGACPHCKTMIDLWITGDGLELSSNGKGYATESSFVRSNTYKKASSPIAENYPAHQPVIIDYQMSIPKSEYDRKKSLLKPILAFLLKPIPCPINFKRTVFFILLSLALVALLIQCLYYFWPTYGEPRLIALNTNWTSIVRNLIFALCILTAVNYLTYKCTFSDSAANKVDRWMLASSIVVFSYYLLGGVVLPLLLIYWLNLPL